MNKFRKFDYHMHTDYSPDSMEKMEDMIKRAIEMGFSEIAITDHADFTKKHQPYKGTYSFEDYVEKINNFIFIFEKDITIKWGMEIGGTPKVSKKINQFIDNYDFDFIILSSHSTEGLDLWSGDFFKNKEKVDSYERYFKEILKNIKLIDKFCVYGHLDFIRRYWKGNDNSLSYFEYKDTIDEILKSLIEKGKGLEVNTSGFRYGLDQIHPQIEILKKYKELGGEILTIGSDAHKKEDIGVDFERSISLIKDAGFEYLTRFEKLKPIFEKID